MMLSPRTVRPLSALGHERTCAPQKAMSALPLKADMCGATRHVRFGPEADIAQSHSQVMVTISYSAADRLHR
jgi:hypothetical protein